MAVADLLLSHTARTVALGAALLGLLSGCLGSFAVLRRQSLLGDAISHAALPGIVLGFLLTGSKSTEVLIAGAAIAGGLGTLLVMSVVNATRVKNDAALGIVLSVFFGFGLVLLTFVQRRPDATQAGLDRFLFGQAAAVLNRDVWILSWAAAIILLLVALFWKEFKLLAFDREFGASLGLPMRRIEVTLTLLLTLAIVLGLQMVGVVLMSAMVVAPAAAARQWTNRLGRMILLAGGFGAFSGVAGAMISSSVERLPTGPTIVLCVSTIVLVSLAAAPGRGLVWQYLQARKNRARVRLASVLVDLYELELQHAPAMPHGHAAGAMRAMSQGQDGVVRSLERLSSRGLAYQASPGHWALTKKGVERAQKLIAEASQNR